MTAATEDRFAHRQLDQRGPRADICPKCGGERRELVVVPDRFYCEVCKVATLGPNTEAPAPKQGEQTGLFSVSDLGADDRPPLDEGMAWVGEEGPDE